LRRPRCLLRAGIGALLLTTPVAAQTLPIPGLPPEPPPEAEPTPPAKPGAKPVEPVAPPEPERPRPWEYAVGAGFGWDSNIDFQVADGPSSVAIVPRGALSRVFWGPRGELRLTGAGRWTGFPEQSDLDRYYATLGLDGSYRTSPTTTWRTRASYEFGYSDSSQVLLAQGVLLPLVKTRTLAAAVGLSQQLGTRTTLVVDARIYQTVFDAPGLVNGQSVRGTVGFQRQLGPLNTATFSYALEDVLSDQAGRYYLTQFGSLQWTRLFSQRSALLLEAGMSYTPDFVLAGLAGKESFFGGVTYRRQVKRSNLTAYVRREVTPAFGTGTSRLDLRVGLGAIVPMGRLWELQMTASQVWPDTPQEIQQAYGVSDDAIVALSRRLGARFELSGESRYRRNGSTTTVPGITEFRAGVFLTLFTPGGRGILPFAGY
jgi:hypothetical protein